VDLPLCDDPAKLKMLKTSANTILSSLNIRHTLSDRYCYAEWFQSSENNMLTATTLCLNVIFCKTLWRMQFSV
jgi:hypothetical protein